MAEQFGRYRLDAVIGRGGMAEVYRAYDTVRQRTVALKRMSAEQSGRPEFEARFRRESHLAAQLSEPHVVPIHDFGEIDGRLFIDMRLVEGRDLATLLADEGPLDPARAVRIVSQLAGALDAAHRAGLVHRDVKPANALVTGDDFVYLADFGIAKGLDGTHATSLTATAGVIGTFAYLAPERMAGREDSRSDVYSLACLLYECLTGARPFERDDSAALMAAHMHEPPPRPGAADPGLAPFDDVISRGMAKDPDQRHASAGELAGAATRALASGRAFATTRSVQARLDPLPATRPLPGRRWRLAALIAAGAAALTAAVVVVIVAPWSGRTEAPPTELPVFTSTTVPTAAPTAAPTTAPVALHVSDTFAVGGSPSALAVAPDGRTVHVVTARVPGQDELITIDLVDGAVVPRPIDVSAAGGGLAVAPGGRSLYVTRCKATRCSLDEIDIATGTFVGSTTTGEIPISAVVDAAGRRAYVVLWRRVGDAVETELAVVDVASRATVGEPIAVAASGREGLAVSPDGGLVLVVDGRSSLSLIDAGRGVPLGRPIPVGVGASDVAVAPDGTRAYVTNAESGTVSVVDLPGRAVLGPPIPVGADPRGVSVSPDGTRVYVANRADGTVSVIDAAAGAVIGEPVPVGREPIAVAVSPDGSQVYVLNAADGTVSLVSAAP